ncbi:hypothetical protein, partial [Microbacterium sp.]|uniref:hypothetical protein n=1 Tax=Microbacterium sp. TaxID=51671 RepID=UPI003A86B9B9
MTVLPDDRSDGEFAARLGGAATRPTRRAATRRAAARGTAAGMRAIRAVSTRHIGVPRVSRISRRGIAPPLTTRAG